MPLISNAGQGRWEASVKAMTHANRRAHHTSNQQLSIKKSDPKPAIGMDDTSGLSTWGPNTGACSRFVLTKGAREGSGRDYRNNVIYFSLHCNVGIIILK